MAFNFDDEDESFGQFSANGKPFSFEEYTNFNDYVSEFIDLSGTDEYVLFTYMDSGKLLVVDMGSLLFCIDRVKDIFYLAPVKNGLSMVSIEQFMDFVEEDE